MKDEFGKEDAQFLTRREAEVARLVTLGKRNLEIARLLVIAESTVETHLHRIYGKLGIHSRTELAQWVMRRTFDTDGVGEG